GLYQSSWYTVAPNAPTSFFEGNDFNGTAWVCAKWNGVTWCDMTMELAHTGSNTQLTFKGWSMAPGAVGNRRISHFQGRTAENRLLTSITLGITTGALLSSARVWIWGHIG